MESQQRLLLLQILRRFCPLARVRRMDTAEHPLLLVASSANVRPIYLFKQYAES
jgi:hypothetical protein